MDWNKNRIGIIEEENERENQMKNRMLLERLIMLYHTIAEDIQPSRHLLYILQDFRNKFNFCPCGFFCKECLMMEVRSQGSLRGILYHIFYHTPLGKIYWWVEGKKTTEGMIL